MKFLTAMLLLVVECNSHDIKAELEAGDHVFFTGYNAALMADDLQFAPADPSRQTTNEDGTFKTTVYTHESEQIQYWGMTASYDEKKIWVNNARSYQLRQIDLGSVGVTVTFDMTRGLENLAYDRITKILYWTDSRDNVIRAVESSFRHFTEVYRSAQLSPYALTVHPVKRKLFFSVNKTDMEFVSDTQLIKSDLDGGDQRAILRFPHVIRPRGITIDFSSDFLFWTDYNILRQATIMTCDLNGGRKKQFFAKSRSYLWGIAYYKGYIYATDIVNTTDNKYEIEIRKTTGRESYTRKLTTRPRNVVIYGPDETATTNVTNECRQSRCEHICLARGNGGFVCKCSPGFTLVSGYKCVSDELTDDYILVADIGQKRLFQLPIRKSASSIGELVAVDLDDVTNYYIWAASTIKKTGGLTWYDRGTGEIVWDKRRISEWKGVASITTGCCNERVYWNTEKDVYSWDGISRRPKDLLTFRSSPNSKFQQIVVDCKAKRIYWVAYNTNKKKSQVGRIDLPVANIVTVLEGLPMSNSLTIDYESYTLHVLTVYEGVVYSIPLKDLETSIPSTSPNHGGYKRTELKPYMNNENVELVGIAVVDGHAYIADDENDAIFRFNWKRGASSMERYGGNQVHFPTAMDFYSETYYEKYLRPICDSRSRQRAMTTAATTTAAIRTGADYCTSQYYKSVAGGVSSSIAFSVLMVCFDTYEFNFG